MADISKIQVNGTEYDIKDAVARSQSGGGSILAGQLEGSQTLSFTGDSACGVVEFISGSDYTFGMLWVKNGHLDMDDTLLNNEFIDIQKNGDTITITANTMAWYIIFNATQA